MDGRRLKDARKEVIPETLYLHIFITDQPQIYQHIGADQKLYDPAGVFVLPLEQKQSQRDRRPDITEIKQVEKIVL